MDTISFSHLIKKLHMLSFNYSKHFFLFFKLDGIFFLDIYYLNSQQLI